VAAVAENATYRTDAVKAGAGPDSRTDSVPGTSEGCPGQDPGLVRLVGEGGGEDHMPENGCRQRVVSGFAGDGKGDVEATVGHRSLAEVEEEGEP
jgi:hypothetical protein